MVGAAGGASVNCPIEGQWSLASQLMDRCPSILQQGRSRVDNPIKLQITENHPKPRRKGSRKTCSFSPNAGGVQSTLSVPSFTCLTSQSLQTSSKDLKAHWKQRQNHGKRDCTAPEPFPSVGERSRCLSHHTTGDIGNMTMSPVTFPTSHGVRSEHKFNITDPGFSTLVLPSCMCLALPRPTCWPEK